MPFRSIKGSCNTAVFPTLPSSVAKHRHSVNQTSFIPSRAMANIQNQPVLCRWGENPCGITLDDISSAGINRHLTDTHFPAGAWHDRTREACQWQVNKPDNSVQPCNTEMYMRNFGKHIATVHLRIMQKICSECGAKLSRGDALRRHRAGYCPGPNAMPGANVSSGF